MSKLEICQVCGKGTYNHGSGLYDYYSCGHAFEKPLNNTESGKWVYYKSPYKVVHNNTTPINPNGDIKK